MAVPYGIRLSVKARHFRYLKLPFGQLEILVLCVPIIIIWNVLRTVTNGDSADFAIFAK